MPLVLGNRSHRHRVLEHLRRAWRRNYPVPPSARHNDFHLATAASLPAQARAERQISGSPKGWPCGLDSCTSISFVPAFRIEGPETFHRFATAGATSQGICAAIGVLFVLEDWRNGWPILMAGSFFLVNEIINQILKAGSLLMPLTEIVGSLNPSMTFFVSFTGFLALLLATGILPKRGPNNSSKPTPLRDAA